MKIFNIAFLAWLLTSCSSTRELERDCLNLVNDTDWKLISPEMVSNYNIETNQFEDELSIWFISVKGIIAQCRSCKSNKGIASSFYEVYPTRIEDYGSQNGGSPTKIGLIINRGCPR